MAKILFLSWRDIKHPQKGGAEIFTHEMLKRLASKGHIIHHLSTKVSKNSPQETRLR